MSKLLNKADMTEEDVKLQFITPAITKAGWRASEHIKMEYAFTDGRIILRGNNAVRGKGKAADYVLYYEPNMPIAIVEAKKNTKSVGHGMQQAIEYAEILDIPFAYSSNGDAFLEHDMLNGTEREIPLDEFPSREELWLKYKKYKGIDNEKEKLILEPYYYEIGEKTPRYYQRIAVNRTIEAIANGQKRILLTMATGERVIIVTGCINALRSRVLGTLVNMIHALLRVIRV